MNPAISTSSRIFLALTTAILTCAPARHSIASPGSPTKDLNCNNLRLKHRPLYSSYTITGNSLIVKNGVDGGKYPTDGIEIPISHYKVRIRSDYQDVVIFATPNIVGEGPFIISRGSCPKYLPDGIELFLP